MAVPFRRGPRPFPECHSGRARRARTSGRGCWYRRCHHGGPGAKTGPAWAVLPVPGAAVIGILRMLRDVAEAALRAPSALGGTVSRSACRHSRATAILISTRANQLAMNAEEAR